MSGGERIDLELRMDSELWHSYKDFPAQPLFLDDIEETRRRLGEWMLSMMAASEGAEDGVEIRDLTIDGLNGAPPIPIRLYSPPAQGERLPALLWIHGGGFTLGSIDGDIPHCRRLASEVGCVVMAVEYRLAPEHPFPAGLEDCYAALRWLATSAAELEVDPERIAVGGESAGGGLAAGLAILARDRSEVQLCYQLLLCPCLDDRHITPSSHEITDARTWNRSQSLSCWGAYLGPCGQDDVSPYAAPARVADCAGLPPTYLMVGDLDLLRDEGIDYGVRLVRAGVPTELHVWPGTFHGFELLIPDTRISRHAVVDYQNSLKRAFDRQVCAAA